MQVLYIVRTHPRCMLHIPDRATTQRHRRMPTSNSSSQATKRRHTRQRPHSYVRFLATHELRQNISHNRPARHHNAIVCVFVPLSVVPPVTKQTTTSQWPQTQRSKSLAFRQSRRSHTRHRRSYSQICQPNTRPPARDLRWPVSDSVNRLAFDGREGLWWRPTRCQQQITFRGPKHRTASALEQQQ